MQSSTVMGEIAQEEGWVVCRIFKKKNHHKTLDSPVMSMTTTMETPNPMTMFESIGNEGALEQIFQYMGKTSCKEEEINISEAAVVATENDNNDDTNDNNRRSRFLPISMNVNNNFNGCGHERFLKLPSLESPNSNSSQNCYQPMNINNNEGMIGDIPSSGFNHHHHHHHDQIMMDSNNLMIMTNWATLDRLVASQLNGQTEDSRQLACFTSKVTTNDPSMDYCTESTTHHNHDDHDHLQVPAVPTLRSSSSSSRKPYHATSLEYSNEMELWSTFARSSSSLSSSDPIYHVSNAPL